MASRASSAASSSLSSRSRRRSDRSPLSSRSSLDSGSVASSVPSERSGYAIGADLDDARSAFRTTRYRRIGPLKSISLLADGQSSLNFTNPNPDKWDGSRLSYADTVLARGEKAEVGKVYYAKGDDIFGTLVGKDTMRRRTDALAIDRAEKAHKRAAAKAAVSKLLRRTSTASSKHRVSTTTMRSDAPAEGPEYLGFVSEVRTNHNREKLASFLTLGGIIVTTGVSDYRNSTLPTVGMLVYGHWDEIGGGLVARQDVQCFGCIRRICDYTSTLEVTTAAGEDVELGLGQVQHSAKLKVGMLVYKPLDGQKYVARVGT